MAKKRSKSLSVDAPANSPVAYPHVAQPLWPLVVEASAVQLDPDNARKHGDEDLAALATSLKRYGQRVPLVVNRSTGYIEKGNGTWRAATELLGWTHLAVVYVDDDPTTATGFAIADNRTAELSEWDQHALAQAIDLLQSEDAELAELLKLTELWATFDAAATDDTDTSGTTREPSITVPEIYGVNVNCGSEEGQRQVYAALLEQFPQLEVKLVTM